MATGILVKRFEEIAAQMEAVFATKRFVSGEYFSGDRVEDEKLLNWQVKARHLLALACGKDSEHYMEFVKTEKPQSYRTNYEMLKELKAVFQAAREDFEGGYLTSVHHLIQAEVYGSELDQAHGLLKGGYFSAAAVIAGVVLETAMRNLCIDAGIAPGNLNKMNTDLAKAGTYNALVQKRITALADIRNNAAHGHPEQFQPSDIADMISYIESFLSQHL